MHLTTFSDLGLRTLMALGDNSDFAQQGNEKTGFASVKLLTINDLADRVHGSRHHLSKVVARLAELGMVESVRGRNGGVRLSDKGRHASVGRLLRKLEGPGETVDCEGTMNCPLASRDCALRRRFAAAQEAFYAELDGDTVDDLIRNTRPTDSGAIFIGIPQHS